MNAHMKIMSFSPMNFRFETNILNKAERKFDIACLLTPIRNSFLNDYCS